ncbi:MAG: hypothetical protein AAF699_15640 [Pseudomonadota bacterium]
MNRHALWILISIFLLLISSGKVSAQDTIFSCFDRVNPSNSNKLEIRRMPDQEFDEIIISGMDPKPVAYLESGAMRSWTMSGGDHQFHMKPDGVTNYYDFRGTDGTASPSASFQCYVKE